MNKKLYSILVISFITCSAFFACGDDDNNNNSTVTEEWMAFNDSVYNSITDNPEYTRRVCLTGNGNIYYKYINEFEIFPEPTALSTEYSPKISHDGYPYFNDSVTVRYMGWYFYKDTKGETQKYTFDGTEDNFNKQNGVGFRISDIGSSGVKGFATMLQYMKVDDQVQVCIPYNLAYGEYGNNSIPGHTTLFFNIFLMKIHPVNPGEFPGVNTGQ